ncbi:MAG: hypothetical protein DMF61_16420 [Blastocatellia bacterium AA13]|nr:MAG: hypothetical protein DMF61_16420 [Blastocatellia bacterium AA13]
MKRNLLPLIAITMLSVSHAAQTQPTPPSTDIFVVDIVDRAKLKFGLPRNITRREGYDNQPEFIDGGRGLLFTSIREDGQADIYRYDFPGGAITRLISTSESEYSPTLTPDGKHFSVIRVEADKSQRLWRFPLAGGAPELILKEIKPVGYHLWLDEHSLLLFILGRPNTLQIADATTQKAELIASDAGRCFRWMPGHKLVSFVQKKSDQESWINSLDIKTREIKPLVKTIQGSEDFAWLSDGSLLMGKGSKLYSWRAGETEWREVGDFSAAGLTAITRLAISPAGNQLAIVAEPFR